jgi:hypothetical protein
MVAIAVRTADDSSASGSSVGLPPTDPFAGASTRGCESTFGRDGDGVVVGGDVVEGVLDGVVGVQGTVVEVVLDEEVDVDELDVDDVVVLGLHEPPSGADVNRADGAPTLPP